MSPRWLRLAVLLTALGSAAPALADCPLVNRSSNEAAVFIGPPASRTQIALAPGSLMNVPEDGHDFTVVLGQGAHGGTCRPGASFAIVRDSSVTWALAPRVIEEGSATGSTTPAPAR